ncbi:MAG TPA: NAD(P)-binding domain-containing protein, partial [Solirubrobacteraceae bacterium]|nr:NAD(P)-binding domain-containing protein [Solirubrobacteraceae bacterium]
MTPPEPTASPSGRPPRTPRLTGPGGKRATVIGAGSFGTALAVLLARGGLRTTLMARTPEQAAALQSERENRTYLPGVPLPQELRIETLAAGLSRADLVFLAVPSNVLGEVAGGLEAAGIGRRAAVVSAAKGLVPPDGLPPTFVLNARFDG